MYCLTELTERSIDRRLFEAGFLFPRNQDRDGNTLSNLNLFLTVILLLNDQLFFKNELIFSDMFSNDSRSLENNFRITLIDG